MTIETLDAKFCPDFTSEQQVDFAVMENDFTAGYTLRNADGINNIRDTWRVNFSQLQFVDMRELWDFLQSKKGYISFFWAPPREAAVRRWTCLKLSRTMESSNNWNVSAVFQESFTHYDDQVSQFHMSGAGAIGHAGDFTITLGFEAGTVGVSGIEVTGTAGTVFPSQII
jgi:phage-related protein